MRRALLICLIAGSAASVNAADAPPPTVTLTQAELQAIISAEATKAVANYIAQQESQKAKTALDKVQSAFAAKKEPTP
jgi:hypothetical protein